MEKERTPRLFITGDTHRDIDIGKLSTKKWKDSNKGRRSSCCGRLRPAMGTWRGCDRQTPPYVVRGKAVYDHFCGRKPRQRGRYKDVS